MEFSPALIGALKEISETLKKQNDFDTLTRLVKEKSEKIGINCESLLRLALDKDYLFDTIVEQTRKIDNEIDAKEKELKQLQERKHIVGSLICTLHEHEYHWDPFEQKQMCKYCGSYFYLGGKDSNTFLSKTNKRKEGIYKKLKK